MRLMKMNEGNVIDWLKLMKENEWLIHKDGELND